MTLDHAARIALQLVAIAAVFVPWCVGVGVIVVLGLERWKRGGA